MNKILKEGDRIEFKDILKPSDEEAGKKANVYVSQIFEFDEEEDIIRVAMPIMKGNLIPLPKDGMFETFFFASKGLYRCKSKILERYKEGNVYAMRISLESELEKYQRRQYFRLEKSFSLLYSGMNDDEYLSIIETRNIPETLMEQTRYIEGVSLDISGGGMRFVGKSMIEPNSKIFIIFDIETSSENVRLRIPANVFLSFEIPGRGQKYEQRVEFENISKESREMLIKYIFEEERRMRKDGR